MYKKRLIEEKVRGAVAHFKIVLLVGPRQVGKTTLLKNLFPDFPLVTFEPTKDVQNARREPDLFLDRYVGPVILDEIQYAPELLDALKIRSDRSEAKGQYILTGSQNVQMLKTVAESMAGRVAILQVDPMTAHEQREISSPPWLLSYLKNPASLIKNKTLIMPNTSLVSCVWRGGMPGTLELSDPWIATYFDSYLKTYIDRDVRTAAASESIIKFEHFVKILAALTAQEINYAQLGRELDMAGKTAKRWLDVLWGSYVWKEILPFTRNAIKRVSQRPKGILMDSGFASHLLNIQSADQFLTSPHAGALFETYIQTTLHAILNAQLTINNLYHWRSAGGAEVDIIIEHNGALYPIEVKMKSSVGKYEARGIKAFQETYKNSQTRIMPGAIIYAGTECYWADHEVIAVPWNMLIED